MPPRCTSEWIDGRYRMLLWYSLSSPLCSIPGVLFIKCFSQFIADSAQVRSFKRSTNSKGAVRTWKSRILEGRCRRLLEKARNTMPSSEDQEKMKRQKQEVRRQQQFERLYCEEIVVEACLHGHINDPHKRNMQEAIRNRFASYSMSVCIASPEIIRLVREMDHDVTEIKTVEVSGEFFDRTFIRYLMVGTGEMSRRNERVQAPHENHAE